MMKVAWELCTKPIIDLWVRVVHSKYGCGLCLVRQEKKKSLKDYEKSQGFG